MFLVLEFDILGYWNATVVENTERGWWDLFFQRIPACFWFWNLRYLGTRMKVLGCFVEQCWLCMEKSVMNEIRVANLRVELGEMWGARF
ncbi:unnamed protein product [Prunus brigantina]